MHVNIFKRKGEQEKTLSLREKKHQANLKKDNGLYFQIGLIISLFVVFGVFQLKFEKKEFASRTVDLVTYDVDEVIYQDYVIEDEIPEKVDEPEPQTDNPKPEDLTDIEIVDDKTKIIETVVKTDDKVKVLDHSPTVDQIQSVETGVDLDPIPVNLVQELPMFPGCEKYSDKKKQMECFSKKIAKHINKKFDVDVASEYGITGKQRLNVTFVINKEGEIEDVRARAPHPALQKEAVKAVNSLPKMKPAKQGYKKVPVRYALPISFQVSD